MQAGTPINRLDPTKCPFCGPTTLACGWDGHSAEHRREAFYASVRAIDALCPACKQPQNAPSCERREHRLPSDTIRPAVWDGYPVDAQP